MRAISPATVSVLINILSKWECNPELRQITLKCFAQMAIVLHRSSPAERQIDLITMCQLYLDVINTLLKTKQFLTKPFDEKFDIASNENGCIDLNSLSAVIDNIECMLSEKQSRTQISYAIVEANFIEILANIPRQIKAWEFDTQRLTVCILRAFVLLSRTSPQIVANLKTTSNICTLFAGIKALGKPTRNIVTMLIDLAYNEERNEILFGSVIKKLIEWIKDMHENEQIYVSEVLLKICIQNLSW